MKPSLRPAPPAPPPNPHRVHFTYFIPSDRPNIYKPGVQRTAISLQIWYKWQMGGKTFTLSDGTVEVYHTQHPASFYSSDQGAGVVPMSPGDMFYPGKRYKILNYHAGDDFGNVGGTNASGAEFVATGANPSLPNVWANGSTVIDMFLCWSANAVNELVAIGGGYGQANDIWVVYLDAPVAGGQIAGGSPSVALLHAKDCASVNGLDPDWTMCRGIGGCGHELGHAFGLGHPIGDPLWEQAIMGVGYSTYPNALFTADEAEQLSTHPFFSANTQNLKFSDKKCTFDSSRPPRPLTFYPIVGVDQASKKVTIEGGQITRTGAAQITDSTGNNGNYTVANSTPNGNDAQWPILGINGPLNRFALDGQAYKQFKVGQIATVEGSLNNDGPYTVMASETDGIYSYVYVSLIPDPVNLGGTIKGPGTSTLQVSQSLPSSVADGQMGI